MALTSFSALYPRVLVEAPGCPTPIVEIAVRDSAIAFCEGSLIYEITLDTLGFPKEYEYDVKLPEDTAVVALVSVRHDESELVPRTRHQIRAMGDWKNSSGTPKYYSHIKGNTFIMVPPPSTDSKDIEVVFALKPTPSATKIDTDVYNDWYDVIKHGALYRIKANYSSEWANPKSAAEHFAQFSRGVAVAKSKIDNSRLKNVVRVTAYGGL